MDTHERIYYCLQPSCSKLKGFTYAGGLKRHEKQIHKMHGGAEFYCPHSGCSRARGAGRAFTRNENLAEHLRLRHSEQPKASSTANRPIALAPAQSEDKLRMVRTKEIGTSGETALLLAAIKQLEQRMAKLEEARAG